MGLATDWGLLLHDGGPIRRARLDGIKVEGLGPSFAAVPATCGVATDDETYGAIWRPLAITER
jgi:hypothetical protein